MFGFNPSTFSDPFDVNKPLGADNRERAKLKSQTFLTDSQLGGAATGIFARNKAEDIMAKANASAQRSQQNASTFGNIMGAVGSIGSFGAAGGFGGGGGSGFSVGDAEVMGMPTGQAQHIGSGGMTEWTTDMPINSWKKY